MDSHYPLGSVKYPSDDTIENLSNVREKLSTLQNVQPLNYCHNLAERLETVGTTHAKSITLTKNSPLLTGWNAFLVSWPTVSTSMLWLNRKLDASCPEPQPHSVSKTNSKQSVCIGVPTCTVDNEYSADIIFSQLLSAPILFTTNKETVISYSGNRLLLISLVVSSLGLWCML